MGSAAESRLSHLQFAGGGAGRGFTSRSPRAVTRARLTRSSLRRRCRRGWRRRGWGRSWRGVTRGEERSVRRTDDDTKMGTRAGRRRGELSRSSPVRAGVVGCASRLPSASSRVTHLDWPGGPCAEQRWARGEVLVAEKEEGGEARGTSEASRERGADHDDPHMTSSGATTSLLSAHASIAAPSDPPRL